MSGPSVMQLLLPYGWCLIGQQKRVGKRKRGRVLPEADPDLQRASEEEQERRDGRENNHSQVEVKRTGTKGELKDQKPCVMAAIIKDNAAEEEEKTVTISFLLYKRNLLCVKAEADVLCAASRGL
ncbi:hypothetical protein Cadr_000024209 [Camelus dromedarius]|uniref:Uncharacterized protein n=1 Tax=Camelus dromedarius TaxID=9838 RepID=A0A5N4CPT2_CAMDR|nr:hypothetical protein Cadr_000024209 [Camelus dromedarius]